MFDSYSSSSRAAVVAASLAWTLTGFSGTASAQSWTGFYVGGNLGYSWGEADTRSTYSHAVTGTKLSSSAGSIDMNGWVAGGQLGYNWQSSNMILGLEADFQWTGQDGRASQSCAATSGCNTSTAFPVLTAPSATSSLAHSLDWFATIRARLGILVQPGLLAYATGGWAYGSIETDGTLAGYTAAGVATTASFSNTSKKSGWVIGGGIESQLGGNWTGKIEYLYVDLGSVSGSATLATSAPPLRLDHSAEITDHILRVGVNYKF